MSAMKKKTTAKKSAPKKKAARKTAGARKTAKKKTAKKKTAAPASRLIPPADGVVVRMYRIGHGDCFLLAFPGTTRPVYVLIDCGYKPGSPAHINTTPKEVCANIRAATGGHIDVAIVTHEHQDHVNAITEANFKDVTIGESWFAWTEHPTDALAKDLRKKFKDKLLGLLAARNRLAAAGDGEPVRRLDRMLAFELGGDSETFNAAAASALLGAAASDPLNSANKKSMKLFKDRASKGVKFLRPHEKIRKLAGTSDVRVFALGPPRDADQLASLDPVGDEAFHLDAFALGSAGSYFASAAMADDGTTAEAPFAGSYCVAWNDALPAKRRRSRRSAANATAGDDRSFFERYYGQKDSASWPAPGSYEVPSDADWRRIDRDWLYSSEQLALDMNNQTNNSSLVLAFELGAGGKVLLFAADAQRGNWISWARKEWSDGDKKVSARDLLGRTVLYKVGHHGSHNATLHGHPSDDYPNLGWMAEGDSAREFTAMITAVRSWAETQNGWDHPLKAIKDALLLKAGGRVFQSDIDWADMAMAGSASPADWADFEQRTPERESLYFDYVVTR